MEKLISIPDLFKKSFALYAPKAWPMILLGLVSWAGSLVIFAIFGTAGFFSFFLGGDIVSFDLLTVLLILIGFLLLMVVNIWVSAALVFMVREEYAKSGIKEILLMVRNKLASYAWVVILESLAVTLGFILFIIPGIIFSIWLAFSQYAFVMEDKKGIKALSYSKELVRGYWWPIFGRLCILALGTMLISSISKVGFLINSLFTMPFGIVYLYVIYKDLKRIKG